MEISGGLFKMEYRLPDAVIRILGILDLAALFVMIFAAVRMKK